MFLPNLKQFLNILLLFFSIENVDSYLRSNSISFSNSILQSSNRLKSYSSKNSGSFIYCSSNMYSNIQKSYIYNSRIENSESPSLTLSKKPSTQPSGQPSSKPSLNGVPIMYFESGITFTGLYSNIFNDESKEAIIKSYANSLNISEIYVHWKDSYFVIPNLKKRLQNYEVKVVLNVNISLSGLFNKFSNSPYILYSILTSNLLTSINTNVLINYLKILLDGLNLDLLKNIAVVKVENSQMFVVNINNNNDDNSLNIIVTDLPTEVPTFLPSNNPTTSPSTQPSYQPSNNPTTSPSRQPSNNPTTSPSTQPSCQPSNNPTTLPTDVPTFLPSIFPTTSPSTSPTYFPLKNPTTSPSSKPTFFASVYPTLLPSLMPSPMPSLEPSHKPSLIPSLEPSHKPSLEPSHKQSQIPSLNTTAFPSYLKLTPQVTINPTEKINTVINSQNGSPEAKTLTYIFMGLFLFMCSISSFMVFHKIKNKLVIINNKYFKKQSLVNDENSIIETKNLSSSSNKLIETKNVSSSSNKLIETKNVSSSSNKITPIDEDDCSSDRSSIISVDCDMKKIDIDNSSDEEV
jgi:hypothetical protein